MKKKYFIILFILLLIYIYIINIEYIPEKIFLIDGEKHNIKILSGITINESEKQIQETWQNQNVKINNYDVILLGKIKVKEVSVITYPKLKVIPAGNLIGLKLYTDGVLVIGTSEIKNIDGVNEKPFENSTIKEGDIIKEINNQKIDSTRNLQKIINDSQGEKVEIKYLRDNQYYLTEIKPIKIAENEYKLGLWVRDSASGVGTMTFYEPERKRFAALGHGISDGDTGELLNIATGEIVNAKVVNVTKGKRGFPGEIRGKISNEETIGKINENTNFGIFGIEDKAIQINNKYKDGVEVALREEIKIGKASMLATLKNGETKEYEVNVVEIDEDNNYNNKSFKIEITDQNLLNESGGIICGMSGAPIIQNNKLIGALTNVLVADPKMGYAVFSDIMIKEMVK